LICFILSPRFYLAIFTVYYALFHLRSFYAYTNYFSLLFAVICMLYMFAILLYFYLFPMLRTPVLLMAFRADAMSRAARRHEVRAMRFDDAHV